MIGTETNRGASASPLMMGEPEYRELDHEKDVLQEGDEWRYSFLEWDKISPDRIGGRPFAGYRYRRPINREPAKPIIMDDEDAVRNELIVGGTTGATSHVEKVEEAGREEADMVNHPPHYTSHPSGVECIQVTEHMGFCLGNAMKYLWRADEKGAALEDLEKAQWYLSREIERRRNAL